MTTSTLDLDTLHLDGGSHSARTEGVCLMEAVAWQAGENHSDMPACVSPVLRVQAGSLLHLTEFARYVGAVSDPKPGEPEDDEDGFGAGDEDLGDEPDEQPAAAAVPAPAFSSEKP